jgi:cytochrome c biogenesis protein ResB
MKMLSGVWRFLCSVSLALYLLGCCSALFFTGAVYYSQAPDIFVALNSTMLFDWLGTYGVDHLGRTWWFFLLMAAFFFLGVNTAMCTIDRMTRIIRSRSLRSQKVTLFLLSPHIVHIAFLVIIAGYFLLYTFGLNSYNNILKPGFRRALPGTSIMMELRDPSFTVPNNRWNESIDGLHVRATFTLLFHDGNRTDQRRIGLNSPCVYRGYSLHVIDFNPSWVKSMTPNVWVKLTIRKNPGIPFFIAGVIIFAVGVLLYAWSVFDRPN